MESLLCLQCAHYRYAYSCDAFPAGIPEAILSGLIEHTSPYPGDAGIIFKLRVTETEIRADSDAPSALRAAQEQLRYWQAECEAAHRFKDANRIVQCERFIKQCEIVISVLDHHHYAE
jgi:hypothetical protein